MSDDAFALTPVAAQPPQPSEAVYQALNAALSATARGRWFLSEFAKRNRNSESSKMLDAVARIEQAVADRPALAAASADLAIARGWAETARAEAMRQLTAPEREAAQLAAQRGTRIIREIAYSMRTVGNDPRICNILDAQLDAIEAAQRDADAPVQGAVAAFDRLLAQLNELIPPPRRAEPAGLAETDVETMPVRSLPQGDPEARFAAVADLAVACATGDPKVGPSAAETEEDDAILARIALEMAMATDDEPPLTAAPAAEPPEPEPDIAPAPPEIAAPPQKDSAGPSLGEALLAQGLVRAPFKSASDPFVALKRLTQAEKIALFT